MLVMTLWRFKSNPQVVPLLVALLDDADVVARALTALRHLKPPGLKPRIRELLQHP